MMAWYLSCILCFLMQAGRVHSFPEGILTPAEKNTIESESNVERRMKTYQTASERIQRTLQSAISNEDFQTVSDNLLLWTSLLAESLKDIESNLKSKKKPRALINYEIHIRKAIGALQDGKIRIPADQQDAFDACIARAAEIREKFVEILFTH